LIRNTPPRGAVIKLLNCAAHARVSEFVQTGIEIASVILERLRASAAIYFHFQHMFDSIGSRQAARKLNWPRRSIHPDHSNPIIFRGVSLTSRKFFDEALKILD